ncbi:calpain-2 catalytic subunit-like [Bufo bufo]|uniref:calpain-2 catalytic subunit-like n=1 Tax=Bufo bufo TaxID=8384 RepID=UPI001ABDCF41|nr:calpain-2 catalytic subunit-like [Bufo bufo]
MSGVASKAARLGSINNPVKFKDQDFEKLKAECLASRTLFEDPEFPAAPASMGFDEYGPESEYVKGLEWKRASALKKNPVFIVGGAEREDVQQGEMLDCWLLASVACLTLNQDCLFRVVPSNQSFDKDYAGIFYFKFWQYGQWMEVVVDDMLPTKDGQLMFVKSNTTHEFWSALLEKAYAKINRSYEALGRGYALESLVDFTGGVGETYRTAEAPADLFQRVQRTLMEKSLTASSTKFVQGEGESINENNVVAGHMYSITGAEEVTCDGKVVKIIRMRNPWGDTEWNGPFSDNADEWGKVDPDVRAKLYVDKLDGETWMPFDDYLKEFKILEICNIHLSEVCCGDDFKWSLTEFNGSWKKGISDGGRKGLARFSINPQYRIQLKAQDGDANKKRTLVVSLTQKDRRKNDMKILNIGFYVYKVAHSDKSPLGKEFFKKNNPIFEHFASYRDVSGQVMLPPGDYVIVAATYSESQEVDFYLRIFTEK